MLKKTGKSAGFAFLWLIIGVVVIGLAFTGYKILKNSNTNSEKSVTNIVKDKLTDKSLPTPTPFLFQEITIPFLRNRIYESKIGELRLFEESSDITSYLTSYNSDDLTVNGYLIIPKGEMPGGGWPAVVFIHGYIPPTVYKTTGNYVSYAEAIAKGGYVVFKIDLRGHDESDGEPGGAYYSGDYVVDTLNAYSALQKTDFVNPKKIGLWGHSMGGNVVFRSFVAKKDIPAAVIWAGAGYTYLDLTEYRIQDNSYRPPAEDTERRRKRELLRNTYGSYEEGHWFWDQVPGTNYLEGVSEAIQINHAVNDNVVNIGYSRNLMNVLEGTDIYHELIEYQSGGHNIEGGSFNAAVQNTIDFYDRYLKNASED